MQTRVNVLSSIEKSEIVLHDFKDSRRTRNILVVSNAKSLHRLQVILTRKYKNLELIGLVNSNKTKSISRDIKILGNLENIEEVLRQYAIDEIYVSSVIGSKEYLKVIEIGKLIGKKVTVILESNQHCFPTQDTVKIEGLSAIISNSPQKTITYRIIKRLFDITFSTLILLTISPLLLLIALAIKIESVKAPIFFLQERVGKNGKRFKVYKFRTMIPDADKLKEQLKHLNEMDGPVFKITNDPRITKLGKFLRKTSLDELPQFLNVIKGDMSVVGPRPLPTKEAISCDIEHQIRHSIKPGITCIWQIAGRNDVTYEEWKKMDIDYVKMSSFILDMKLIYKTVVAVVGMTGK